MITERTMNYFNANDMTGTFFTAQYLQTFIRDIDPYAADGSLNEKMHILTGDFNCVLDKEIDRYPYRNYDDTGAKELKII
jgi:hypothetical protein